ncbi:hypothetical protein LUZ63_002634 [Rhynchospora breviuscula]|uniref:LYR motif containing domain-containing protein n=1 Tax=Rhynchospora breviuscula TaxID=2022672 RepID=A0A9Q0HYP1_9POAL|nr:hypothetical protein LUZ63_002634 [Rhynchospora breviuscula]
MNKKHDGNLVLLVYPHPPPGPNSVTFSFQFSLPPFLTRTSHPSSQAPPRPPNTSHLSLSLSLPPSKNPNPTSNPPRGQLLGNLETSARNSIMSKGLIWATAEDIAKNRPVVLSLYRQILRCLNSPDLPLTHAARLAKKAEARTIFLFGSEERSVHNIADLIDAAKHSLSILKQGRLP